MIILAGFMNGLREIRAHKFRSALSLLGILLGVASLITIMGYGEGMVKDFKLFFEQSGGINKIKVLKKDPPDEQKDIAYLSPGHTMDDAHALEASATAIAYVSPGIDLRWKPVRHGYHSRWGRMHGVTHNAIVVNDIEMAKGRFIGDLDVYNKEFVIVLGSDQAQRLFGNQDPIGKLVHIWQNPMRVIGVRKELVSMSGGRNILHRENRISYIPITTAMHIFQENEEISWLDIYIEDTDNLQTAIQQTENVIHIMHNGIEDYEIETAEAEYAKIKDREQSYRIALGTIAGISLLVGGIGITNVMLASVNERVREIGVRKAVGARAIDIFLQFLAEAILISILGGLLGVGAGIFLLDFLNSALPKDSPSAILTTESMLLGFAFSVGTGIFSGIFPAIKAAGLNPIEALRHD